MTKGGTFIISLDFELMWGVFDSRTAENYGKNIEQVHKIVPALLDLFNKYNVVGTFATVGFLFNRNLEELRANYPNHLPSYRKMELSAYNGYIDQLNRDSEIIHFCPELIELLKSNDRHEIASHTYGHYYCLEEGQNIEQFNADLEMAKNMAGKWGIELKSLVFPRNQTNMNYLQACKEHGIYAYRGTEKSYLYRAKNREDESLFRRALRLMDAYLNISGHHTYDLMEVELKPIVNLPASRFFRAYSEKLFLFEKLKLRRIKKSMSKAARLSQVYHLWWHPHNFSTHFEENMQQLEDILRHYTALNNRYNFKSKTMIQAAKDAANTSL